MSLLLLFRNIGATPPEPEPEPPVADYTLPGGGGPGGGGRARRLKRKHDRWQEEVDLASARARLLAEQDTWSAAQPKRAVEAPPVAPAPVLPKFEPAVWERQIEPQRAKLAEIERQAAETRAELARIDALDQELAQMDIDFMMWIAEQDDSED